VKAGEEMIKAIEPEMAGAIRQIGILIEKYPELRAQEVVQRLYRELTAIEDKIAHGRKIYNESVSEFNENVLKFPRGIVARLFGFKHKTFFQAEGDEREARKVSI
jgi:LemA protein